MAKKKYGFRVVIDGIDLGPEVEERLADAVAGAALGELADLDLGGDFASLRAPSGGLRGRSFVALAEGQAETLGLDA